MYNTCTFLCNTVSTLVFIIHHHIRMHNSYNRDNTSCIIQKQQSTVAWWSSRCTHRHILCVIRLWLNFWTNYRQYDMGIKCCIICIIVYYIIQHCVPECRNKYYWTAYLYTDNTLHGVPETQVFIYTYDTTLTVVTQIILAQSHTRTHARTHAHTHTHTNAGRPGEKYSLTTIDCQSQFYPRWSQAVLNRPWVFLWT